MLAQRAGEMVTLGAAGTWWGDGHTGISGYIVIPGSSEHTGGRWSYWAAVGTWKEDGHTGQQWAHKREMTTWLGDRHMDG